MEEEMEAQTARNNCLAELVTEVKGVTEHFESKSDLQERIITWCNELMDDLLLVDFEDLEISRYRRPVNDIRLSIEESWNKINVCFQIITSDVAWLQNNIDSVEPDGEELWWMMSEGVKKRLIYIRDHFLKFFETYVEFKELIRNYSERFKDKPHIDYIFEKYRHFE